MRAAPAIVCDRVVLATCLTTRSSAQHVWLYTRYEWVRPEHYAQVFFPTTHVAREMRWTYFFELSWYVTGLVLLFLDFKRKDFAVMLVHHLVRPTCRNLSPQMLSAHRFQPWSRQPSL